MPEPVLVLVAFLAGVLMSTWVWVLIGWPVLVEGIIAKAIASIATAELNRLRDREPPP